MDLPIACTLDVGQLKDRLAEMNAVGRNALRAVEPGSRRAVLRFARKEAVRERLARIVEAESRCCAFMGFELRERADEIVLTISAPEGAEPVLDDLVAAFSSAERT
jgi:hypothetical protein